MRKSIIVICIVIFAFCLWLLQYRKTEPVEIGSPEIYTSQTNQPSTNQPTLIKSLDVPKGTIVSNFAPIPAQRSGPDISNVISQKVQADWQKPIEFYGKVIDEDSNPVAGASIQFRWSGLSDKVFTAKTESDAEGLFSLQGKQGRVLDVSVGKDGYFNSRKDKTGFLYSLGPEVYSPDSLNPVVFHLRKKGAGESLVGSDFPGFAHIAQLHHDGTPVELDLYKGTQVPAGRGQFKLEFWRDISNKNANVFNWKLQLSVSGGGLVPTDEEFAFQAPEGGYKPLVVIDMPATNQDWIGTLRSKYYIQLPDRKYGRIDVYLLPYNGVFTVQSAINLTGSRNLEPQ